MTFATCLADLEASGAIDAERARRFRSEYERLERSHAKAVGKAAAIDAASRDTLDALEFQALKDRRQAMLAARTQMGLLGDLQAHVAAGGKAGQFAISVMEHHEAVGGRVGVENMRGAIEKLAWSRMSGFMQRHRRDLLGRMRRGDEMVETVRALRGEGTDNVNAKRMAEAIADTMEWLRVQFNAAGGAIPKLEGWGLPQSHDALSIAKAELDGWRDFIKPLLDPSKMIDTSTGKAFASEEALDEALEAAWRNISSEGMDGAVPGSFTGSGKIANRRLDHRFLVFKNADAWLAYNDRFGTGDAFNSIVGHIGSMSRDIAAMRVLGPNPAHTIRWLRDVMNQQALPGATGGKAAKLDGKARKGARTMERMWRYYAGELTAVAPENKATARLFMGLRNWNVMSKLGRAALAAMPTDPVFKAYTARFNGLPVAGTIGDYLKTFNPADASHREAAADAGLVFTEMAARAEKMWREGQGVNLVEFTRRGADALLRASFLTPHTLAAKQSLGLSFMRDWAKHAATGFDDLAPPKRMALERYGIDAADWDRLRAVAIDETGGVRLLRPGDLARSGDDADLATAVKFFSLIDSETRFDTPGELLRAQTMLALGGRDSAFERGTVIGELAHSMTQFKTYSVILVTTHLFRALYGRGGMNSAAYGLTLPIMLTIAGTTALSLREIADGKDPPDWSDPLTWGRGFVTGGGLGIVGDIAASGFEGQRGTTGVVGSFITGPTIGSIVDPALSLTLGNIGQAARGEETSWQRELFKQAKLNMPFQNLWWGKLAIHRGMLDQLQTIIDPNYRQSWKRMERYAREQGTRFWWAPGETMPERAPDFSNALAEGPSE